MASTRISAPVRDAASQLTRPCPVNLHKSIASSFARSITSSSSSHASVSNNIATSLDAHAPIVPFAHQTVNATIHHFPSLEPLRFEPYPANHLYLPTRRDILHRAVIFEGDAARRGTASTKWRSEVHGSARKIRPQKGSGKARLGDKKSPMLKGGGVAHGPKPRDFSTGLQKKVYDLAVRTAISYRFRKGELIIVDNALEIESPSSELLKAIFSVHGWWAKSSGPSLFITAEERPLLEATLTQSPSRGLALAWNEIDVKDLLGQGRIIIESGALQRILLVHQDDLPQQPGSSKPLINDIPKMREELADVTGWAEFRELEIAALEQEPRRQLLLKGLLYTQAAEKRQRQARTEADAESLRLRLSALELTVEGFDAQAEAITIQHDLARQAAEKDKLLEQKDAYAPDYLQLVRDSTWLRTQAWNQEVKQLRLKAKSARTRAQGFHLQGMEDAAFQWQEQARDLLNEANDKNGEILTDLKNVDMEGASLQEVTKFKKQKKLIKFRQSLHEKSLKQDEQPVAGAEEALD